MPTFLIVESRFTNKFNITASKSKTPKNAFNQFGYQPAKKIHKQVMPKMNAPMATPHALP